MAGTADAVLTPLEVASGTVLGSDPRSVDLPRPSRGETLRGALERALLPALARPPCVIAFSGGRDSSALLAVACHVARQEGLDAPVPLTFRFAAAPETDEREWQELVVSQLGIEDWVRLDLDDELDLVGPIASTVMRRHGLLWPVNAHIHVLPARAAAGGSLVTGTGGDQLFGWSRLSRHRALLTGSTAPRPRDLLRVAYALAPARLRRSVVRRRVEGPPALPWLLPDARTALHDDWIASDASEPVRPRMHVRWLLGLRAFRVGVHAFRLVVADEGARLFQPFLDPAFAAVAASAPARSFYSDRTRAMRELAGDLLPDEVCARTSKAYFRLPFWNRHTSAFVERWDGSGVDGRLVDAEALRAHWLGHEPVGQSMTLVQAAWLRSEGAASAGDVGEPLEEKRAG